MNFKKIFDLFKNSKNSMYNLVIILLLGVFIVIVTSFFNNGTKASISNENHQEKGETLNDMSSYEQKMKNELKYALSKIRGVGSVEVVIYFESGEEQVPAVDVNRTYSTTQEKDNSGGNRVNNQTSDGSKVVITNKSNGSEPLILKTYKPKITGVLIVAQGAEDKKIQYEITKVVSTLYNIPQNKVNVCSMES
ncbi:stage III sporulation protein AG [Desnuesiella massiliensis]|uniref:stage III sporulation protein AG n=1 Tax=Desnuesiella massiliensis TaxID=1650662 RepID=UPI0006E1846F|nr:stage III sporulation protein AG [Desnuesiella massiliensis]